MSVSSNDKGLLTAENRNSASQQIEAETAGVFFHRPIRPKFQNRRGHEL